MLTIQPKIEPSKITLLYDKNNEADCHRINQYIAIANRKFSDNLKMFDQQPCEDGLHKLVFVFQPEHRWLTVRRYDLLLESCQETFTLNGVMEAEFRVEIKADSIEDAKKKYETNAKTNLGHAISYTKGNYKLLITQWDESDDHKNAVQEEI